MSVDKIVEKVKSKEKCTLLVISKLILYILVMLLLGGILFWLCLESVLNYSKWPIYTETNIVSQSQAKFPSMTFCALSNGYKEDILKVSISLSQFLVFFTHKSIATSTLMKY